MDGEEEDIAAGIRRVRIGVGGGMNRLAAIWRDVD